MAIVDTIGLYILLVMLSVLFGQDKGNRFNGHFDLIPYNYHKILCSRWLWIWCTVAVLKNYNRWYN